MLLDLVGILCSAGVTVTNFRALFELLSEGWANPRGVNRCLRQHVLRCFGVMATHLNLSQHKASPSAFWSLGGKGAALELAQVIG